MEFGAGSVAVAQCTSECGVSKVAELCVEAALTSFILLTFLGGSNP